MRILSGIKPTGRPHLGNYLGAIRNHIELQNEGHECFFFIADLHALTSLRDAAKLREYSLGVAMDYLALGLNPEKVTLFCQSEISAHAELSWVLSTVTPHGLLERGHAWKDALDKGDRDTNVGLFTYPVLMAADILLYDADQVPVGKDQKQHIEIARDIAEKFNHFYGETFKLPEPRIEESVATVTGVDGRKMSKSYNNTIGIFEDEATLKKQIMGIQTQSVPLENPMPIENDIVLELYAHFSTAAELQELKEKYQAGGFGYGNAKKALLEKVLAHFAEARERRKHFEAHPEEVEAILRNGAQKAGIVAQKTLERVYKGCGLR